MKVLMKNTNLNLVFGALCLWQALNVVSAIEIPGLYDNCIPCTGLGNYYCQGDEILVNVN